MHLCSCLCIDINEQINFTEANFDMEEVEIQNLKWRRPDNIPWPKVWHRFEARSKSGQMYRIKIQDIPEDRYDEVLDFMETEFDKNEPISS